MINFLYLCVGIVLPVGLYFAARRLASYTDVGMYEVTDGMCAVDKESLLQIVLDCKSEHGGSQGIPEQLDALESMDIDKLRVLASELASTSPGEALHEILRDRASDPDGSRTGTGILDGAADALKLKAALLSAIIESTKEGNYGKMVRERKLSREIALDKRQRLRRNLDKIKTELGRICANAARPRFWALTDQRHITENCLEYPPEVFEAIARVLELERELRSLVRRVQFRIWLWSMSGFHKRVWLFAFRNHGLVAWPMPDILTLSIPQIVEAYERVILAASNLARCCGEAVVAEDIAASM